LKTKEFQEPSDAIHQNITNNVEFESFKNFVENSFYLNSAKHNVYKGWVVHKYSEKLLREYFNNKNFAVWLENGNIKGCAIWSHVHYKDVFWVSILEVADEKMFREFQNYFFYLMKKKDKKEIEILVPTVQLLQFCNNNGFTSWEQENDFYLYELPQEIIDQISQE
jgi:hypothetical protein